MSASPWPPARQKTPRCRRRTARPAAPPAQEAEPATQSSRSAEIEERQANGRGLAWVARVENGYANRSIRLLPQAGFDSPCYHLGHAEISDPVRLRSRIAPG